MYYAHRRKRKIQATILILLGAAHAQTDRWANIQPTIFIRRKRNVLIFLFLDFKQQFFVRETNCESSFFAIRNDVSLSFGLVFFIRTKIALAKWMSKRTRTHTQRQENHRSELIIFYIFFSCFLLLLFVGSLRAWWCYLKQIVCTYWLYIAAGICCVYSEQDISDAVRNVLLCTHTEWYMNNVWNERARFGFISQLLMYQ